MPPLDLPRADPPPADGAPDPLGTAVPAPPPDAALLDSYSDAVTAAVAKVAPAVAHVRVERAKAGRWARDGSGSGFVITRSEEHTSELQSRLHLVCRLLLEKKKKTSLSTFAPQ